MPSEAQPPARPFYLTTPIYYVNGRPHIGTAYTTLVADVLARRHRMLGDDVLFLTGTDEHGQKVERSAARAGIPPQQFADEVSAEFRALWDRMGLTYDRYIRTTDPAHQRGVQQLFRTLYDRGYIYLSTYTGSYCVSDEAFVDLPVGTPCPDCGRLLETLTEENFFFKLSAFQQTLLDLIESNTLRITPDTARNEVLSFVRGGLKDLSVSRSTFSWGIPVPQDIQNAAGAMQPHITYVWLDALANYITAIGYGSATAEAQADFARYWPADLHLVGKEITRFHCVYWPAFLLAAELPTPKQITAHGWLLFDNAKMSKSKGNVVRTETILDAFGDHVYGKQFPDSSKRECDLFAADVLRYFLLREIPFGQDGSFSFDALITRYNADLANGYGNLVSRTLAMVEQYFSGIVPDAAIRTAATDQYSLIGGYGVDKPADSGDGFQLHYPSEMNALPEAFFFNFDKLQFSRAFEALWIAAGIVDGEITSKAPWKLVSGFSPAEQNAYRSEVLYTATESIRILTLLLHPVMPYTTARVWQQLGLGRIDEPRTTDNEQRFSPRWGGLAPGTKLGPLGPLFPRAEKSLAQVMIDMEDARNAPTPAPSELANSPLVTEPAPSTDPAAAPRTTALETPAAAAPNPPATPDAEAAPITIDDFLKVELRVAQVLVAERIPKADKLLRLEVDLGTEKRQILSGIAQWYTPEELVGRRIVVVSNLAPRKMRGLESHGMLLAASEGADGKPVLATFGEEIALGARVR